MKKRDIISMCCPMKIIIVLVMLFFSAAWTFAATYYVSVNGDDKNPGSKDKPWRTIQKASNSIAAGDVVIVGSGNYDERVELPAGLSGTSNARIVFRAYPRRTVEMKGFVANRNNYIRIEGFNITNHNPGSWLGGGIWLDGHHWEIVDNYFHDIAGSAIQPTWQEGHSIDYAYVANNYIYKCNKGFIIAGNGWLVENNNVERLVYYNEDADYCRFFGTNHIIRRNFFHGTSYSEIGDSHVDGFQTFSNNGGIAQNIIIEENIVEGPVHEIMMLEGTNISHFNIIVRNNIFTNSSSWGICDDGGVKDLLIYNNLFAYISSSAIGIRKSRVDSSPSNAIIKNNIFYNVKSSYWHDEKSSIVASNNLHFSTEDKIDSSRYPGDLVNVDPLFNNPAPTGGDFHVGKNSPLVDAGEAIDDFNSSLNEVTRPQVKTWDIGPYEYMATGNSSAPPSPKNLKIIGQ